MAIKNSTIIDLHIYMQELRRMMDPTPHSIIKVFQDDLTAIAKSPEKSAALRQVLVRLGGRIHEVYCELLDGET